VVQFGGESRPARAVSEVHRPGGDARAPGRIGQQPLVAVHRHLAIGVADGTIYASVALALVLAHRVSGTINFAQGEMAMFSAFIAWTCIVTFGWPYPLAFVVALVASFGIGVALQVGLVRPVGRRSDFGLLLLTIGLFYLFNGVAGTLWGYTTHSFPSPFANSPIDLGGVFVTPRHIATLAITVAVVGICAVFFRFTNFGLAMRAAAAQPDESALLGISVRRVQAVGWGFAASVGAVAGLLVAPIQFLEPNMMQPPLLFAFAAVVLGGTDSMVGAVVGGLIVGVVLSFGTYLVPSLQTLNPVIAFAVIVLVLFIRPHGLFGRAAVSRA